MNREYYQHTPLSIALIEEKAVRLNAAVKEVTVIVAKETIFQEVSKDAIEGLLESRSVILMHEEQAGRTGERIKEHRITMAMMRV
jgi:hypothetical protein